MTAAASLGRTRFTLKRAEGAWQGQGLALAIVAAALLILFRRDAAAMASIWWNSSTFNHVLLIPPIIAWLVMQRRDELARLTPAAWWPGVVLVAVAAIGWLIGMAAGVDFARQLGLVMMLQGAVVALLGPAVARAVAFPLGYALFLVPLGEELVPPLQTLTAQMCMALLHLTGVPASIDGVFISTPTGWFEVAEACSGVKFLIAMIAYGALVAHVCFRSWPRRIGFMAAAVIIPVMANGVRAFGTIWIAHRTSNDFAAGFDHIFYGWIFFALVIALVMAAGWRFFDRRVGDRWCDVEALAAIRFRAAPVRGVAGVVVAIALVPLIWSAAGRAAPLPPAALPMPAGWQRTGEPQAVRWSPRFAGADRVIAGRYRDATGGVVDLVIAVYARQEDKRELVGFGQGAVPPESDWAWSANARAIPGGRAERIVAPGPVRREVVSFYRVGDRLTGSDTAVKLETLRVRLLGGPQRAVAVLVSAEGGAARPTIDRFLSALGPIETLADRAAGLE